MFEKFISALGIKSQQPEITQVINLYDAVLAHTAWKRRLFEFLEGQSKENLQPDKIRVDYLCVLGKWIHSDGKAHFGDQPEFIKLMEEHAKFHVHAASVVEAHLAGKTDQAMEILTGSFDDQSRKTVKCLTKLNAVVEAAKK
ncbi:MAG: CZB domain-containing protein [Nitrosomonadales bacterium]|nr:CZB domain-containing protein [Nitrosomonadales bacterium]